MIEAELTAAGLVDVRTYCPGVVCNMRYLAPSNVTGKALYTRDMCYVRLPVARALYGAQQQLAEQGIGLKIWDAYRPMSVQAALLAIESGGDYVALESNHSRGITVDVTLIELAAGHELPMPTEFDTFSPAAHADAPLDDVEILHNRTLLATTMQSVGFTPYPYEWWHFDFLSLADAPLLDIRI